MEDEQFRHSLHATTSQAVVMIREARRMSYLCVGAVAGPEM